MTLGEFVRALTARPFAFGACDCALAVADWAALRLGSDPAAHLRGTYADDAGWRAIADAAGGLPALFDGILLGRGIARTDAPLPGDVGIVETRLGPTAAIRTGSRWAMKVHNGVAVVGGLPVLAAWRLP